jgi:hypothetical protein
MPGLSGGAAGVSRADAAYGRKGLHLASATVDIKYAIHSPVSPVNPRQCSFISNASRSVPSYCILLRTGTNLTDIRSSLVLRTEPTRGPMSRARHETVGRLVEM